MKHLWDIDHPYYCNEGNYFTTASECSCHYHRWQDFIDEQGDADLDMNLVFRFDWCAPHPNGDTQKSILWQGDEYYRDSLLKLFYMGQRKGLYRWVTIDVCRADEPAVREWLQIRWNHLCELWQPFEQPLTESEVMSP